MIPRLIPLAVFEPNCPPLFFACSAASASSVRARRARSRVHTSSRARQTSGRSASALDASGTAAAAAAAAPPLIKTTWHSPRKSVALRRSSTRRACPVHGPRSRSSVPPSMRAAQGRSQARPSGQVARPRARVRRLVRTRASTAMSCAPLGAPLPIEFAPVGDVDRGYLRLSTTPPLLA